MLWLFCLIDRRLCICGSGGLVWNVGGNLYVRCIVSTIYTNFFAHIFELFWQSFMPSARTFVGHLSLVIALRYECSTWISCNSLGNMFKYIWGKFRNCAPLCAGAQLFALNGRWQHFFVVFCGYSILFEFRIHDVYLMLLAGQKFQWSATVAQLGYVNRAWYGFCVVMQMWSRVCCVLRPWAVVGICCTLKWKSNIFQIGYRMRHSMHLHSKAMLH